MQVTDESSNVITDESGNTLMFPPYVSTFSVPGSGQSYLLLK